jgi:hypothetical protein
MGRIPTVHKSQQPGRIFMNLQRGGLENLMEENHLGDQDVNEKQ